MTTTDLGDTSRCPLGLRCESCGLEAGSALAVYTTECALGVMCLTMCPRCSRATGDVNVAVSTATRLVIQHAGHLGVTVADMRMLQSAPGAAAVAAPGLPAETAGLEA